MKACFVCKPWMKDLGLLLLRVTVGVIFIYHGWSKLANIEATSSFFAAQGFPAETFTAYFVGLVELLAGASVLLGFYTKMAATLLAIVMLVAIFTVHIGDLKTAELPFALLGSNLGLMAVGAGAWRVCKDCACCK